jgi:hypothetical protein
VAGAVREAAVASGCAREFKDAPADG